MSSTNTSLSEHIQSSRVPNWRNPRRDPPFRRSKFKEIIEVLMTRNPSIKRRMASNPRIRENVMKMLLRIETRIYYTSLSFDEYINSNSFITKMRSMLPRQGQGEFSVISLDDIQPDPIETRPVNTRYNLRSNGPEENPPEPSLNIIEYDEDIQNFILNVVTTPSEQEAQQNRVNPRQIYRRIPIPTQTSRVRFTLYRTANAA